MHKKNHTVISLLEACITQEQEKINQISMALSSPTLRQNQLLQFERLLINAQKKEIAKMKETGYIATHVKQEKLTNKIDVK